MSWIGQLPKDPTCRHISFKHENVLCKRPSDHTPLVFWSRYICSTSRSSFTKALYGNSGRPLLYERIQKRHVWSTRDSITKRIINKRKIIAVVTCACCLIKINSRTLEVLEWGKLHRIVMAISGLTANLQIMEKYFVPNFYGEQVHICCTLRNASDSQCKLVILSLVPGEALSSSSQQLVVL